MSKYKRGTREFGEQPGQRSNERWDQDIDKLEPPPLRRPVLIRPVAGILTVGVHYVVFKSPKDGKRKGFYCLCPNWNLQEQKDQDAGCPVCADFHKYIQVPEADKDLKMPQKYRYLFHAFHVSNIRDGLTDPSRVFGIVETHAIGMQKIEQAMLLRGSTKPDDPEKGYCLAWLRTESQKGTQYGGDETSFTADRAVVVREKENGIWQIKIGKKITTGTEQKLLELIPSPPKPQDLSKKLVELGAYAALAKATGTSVSLSGARSVEEAPPMGDDQDDWGEGDDAGQDDAGDDWSDSTTEAETSETDDAGDDWGDEAAAEPEAEADPNGDDWGEAGDAESEAEAETDPDGDDWDEAAAEPEGDDWVEEEAKPDPSKKPSKPKPRKPAKPKPKKPGRKPAVKKPAKKEAAAPAEDDWSDWD